MRKSILAIGIILVIMGTFISCMNINQKDSTSNAKAQKGKVQVVVSFNALGEFAEAIGKDKVQVKTIIPEGTEPHDFEPKIRDFESINSASIFVYNGLDMEAWVDNTLQNVNNKNLIVVNASKGISPIKASEGAEAEGEGKYDPHIWLSLKNAEIEAANIRDALIKADKGNKDFYENNYKTFADKLEALYSEYKGKFDKLDNKYFVTGHAAFAYFCRDFGLKQNSVEDVFAEEEPSAKKMKELVDFCKSNKIKTIFIEDMVSPKVSQTLASEAGAKVEKIYTIESREDNKDYIESMESNLSKVYESLQ